MSQPSLNSSHFVLLVPSTLGLLDLNQVSPCLLGCVHTDYLPPHGTLTGNLNILRWGSLSPLPLPSTPTPDSVAVYSGNANPI